MVLAALCRLRSSADTRISIKLLKMPVTFFLDYGVHHVETEWAKCLTSL